MDLNHCLFVLKAVNDETWLFFTANMAVVWAATYVLCGGLMPNPTVDFRCFFVFQSVCVYSFFLFFQ